MNVKQENLKIVTVSFIALSFLCAFIIRVLFETLASAFGVFARFYSIDALRHGAPLVGGLILFLLFQFQKPWQKIADEVATEVRKVVWPGKKELYAMTLLVSVILIVSGLVLGFFDMVSGVSVRFFMD